MSYSQINCFNACVMNPIGSPIIDHPSQISYPKNGSLLLKKHHSQGISPGDVGLLFSFPFWSQLAMSSSDDWQRRAPCLGGPCCPDRSAWCRWRLCGSVGLCTSHPHLGMWKQPWFLGKTHEEPKKNIKAPSKKVFLEMFVATSWTKAWKSEAFAAPLACFNFSHLGCPPQFAQLPKLQM